MKLNENLKIEQLPIGNSTALIIDNTFEDPSKILTEENFKFESKEKPLIPFPLGSRTRLSLDNSIIDLVNDHYKKSFTKINAELILTEGMDIENYESNLNERIVYDNDEYEYMPPDQLERKEKDRYKNKGEPIGLVLDNKEKYTKYINNHPARPIFDMDDRYLCYVFFQDYNKPELENIPQHKKISLDFYKHIINFLEETDESYKDGFFNDYTEGEIHNLIYHWDLYAFIESKKGAASDRGTLPIIHDNFSKQHRFNFKKTVSIENKFNRMVIFPGNFFHMLSVSKELLYPTLMMCIVIE